MAPSPRGGLAVACTDAAHPHRCSRRGADRARRPDQPRPARGRSRGRRRGGPRPATGPARSPPSTAFPASLGLLRRAREPTPTSTPSTTRCPTACTGDGRWPPWRPASTCCARSPSPPTPTRPGGGGGDPAPGVVVMEAFHYRYHPVFCARSRIARRGGGRARCSASRRGSASRCRCSRTSATSSTWPAGPPWTPAATPSTWPGTSPAPSPRSSRPGPSSGRRGWTVPCRPTFASTAAPPVGSRARCGRGDSSTSASSVTGDAGELRVFNPVGPNIYSRLSVRGPGGRQVEHLQQAPHLRVPARGVLRGGQRGRPSITDVTDAIANMEVIDAVYRHAGLEPRSPTP